MKVKEMRALRAQIGSEDIDEFEDGIALLQKYVVDWNWIGDDGEPLPKPQVDPTVFEELYDEETKFLAVSLVGDAVALKN